MRETRRIQHFLSITFALLSPWLLIPPGCSRDRPTATTGAYATGEMQAVIDYGDLRDPSAFMAEKGVRISMFPAGTGGELTMHATSDVMERMALAMVFDLEDANLPGTVDLAHHCVVLMELDHTGTAESVWDGVPTGTADVHGRLEPGGEIYGSFDLTLPATAELPEASIGGGTFSGTIAAP